MRVPPTFQYELTERCNHGCSYCYNSFRDSPSNDNNDTSKIALSLAKTGVFHSIITGGEPLLVPDKLRLAASAFYDENVSFSINSNMTLADKDVLNDMKRLGLVNFLASVMSYDPRHYEETSRVPGSFERMRAGLEVTCKLNIPIAVNMVLTQINKKDVYDTAKGLYQDFGNAITSFSVTPMVPTPGRLINIGVSAEEFKEGLKELRRVKKDFGYIVDSVNPLLPCTVNEEQEKYAFFLRRACSAVRGTFSSGAEGSIRPCSHSSEIYGNILTEDIKTIMSRMTKWTDGSLVPKKCKE